MGVGHVFWGERRNWDVDVVRLSVPIEIYEGVLVKVEGLI